MVRGMTRNNVNSASINIAKRQNKLIKSFISASSDISTPAKKQHYENIYTAGSSHRQLHKGAKIYKGIGNK